MLKKCRHRAASKFKLYSETKRKVSHFTEITNTIAAVVNKNYVEALKKLIFNEITKECLSSIVRYFDN